MKVTWTTPRFGFVRYGFCWHDALPLEGSVRVDFGADEVRDLPVEQLEEGWSPLTVAHRLPAPLRDQSVRGRHGRESNPRLA